MVAEVRREQIGIATLLVRLKVQQSALCALLEALNKTLDLELINRRLALVRIPENGGGVEDRLLQVEFANKRPIS